MLSRSLIGFGLLAGGVGVALAFSSGFDRSPVSGRSAYDGALIAGADALTALRTQTAEAPVKAPEGGTVPVPGPISGTAASRTAAPAAVPVTVAKLPAAPLKPVEVPLRSLKPEDDGTRVAMTRDIQTELGRLGCYTGSLNGSWTRSTQAAVERFNAGSNGAMPTDGPDLALLTLARSMVGTVCGPNATRVAAPAALPPVVQEAPAADAAPGTAPELASSGTPEVTIEGQPPATGAEPLPGRMSLGATPEPRRRVGPSPRSVGDILRHPLGTM